MLLLLILLSRPIIPRSNSTFVSLVYRSIYLSSQLFLGHPFHSLSNLKWRGIYISIYFFFCPEVIRTNNKYCVGLHTQSESSTLYCSCCLLIYMWGYVYVITKANLLTLCYKSDFSPTSSLFVCAYRLNDLLNAERDGLLHII